MKYCPACKQDLPTEAFSKAKTRSDGLQSACKTCKHLQYLTRTSCRREEVHGMSDTKTYKSWFNMKRRCQDPNRSNYNYYGGRGITVCDTWLKSFLAFFTDMGERPPGLSLDRIDNNGNYEPGNCRWATASKQANNRRNNVVNGGDQPCS